MHLILKRWSSDYGMLTNLNKNLVNAYFEGLEKQPKMEFEHRWNKFITFRAEYLEIKETLYCKLLKHSSHVFFHLYIMTQ